MSDTMTEPVKRWTAKRKSALVVEILQGKTTVAQASRSYDLSPSEIEGWVDDERKMEDGKLIEHERSGQLYDAAFDDVSDRGFLERSEHSFDETSVRGLFCDMTTPNQADQLAAKIEQKTAYEITTRLVGSEMCIRDRSGAILYRDNADTGGATTYVYRPSETLLML